MPRQSRAFLLLLAVLTLPAGLNAQSPFFATGLAGAGFSLNDIGPGTGGGFGYQGAVGVALRRVSIGGEMTQQALGYDRKARILGGFVRFSAPVSGPIQPYLTLGVGAYRFAPVSGTATTILGGSVGPGALFRLGMPRVRLVLEARIHTDLHGVARVSTHEFVTALGGFQVDL